MGKLEDPAAAPTVTRPDDTSTAAAPAPDADLPGYSSTAAPPAYGEAPAAQQQLHTLSSAPIPLAAVHVVENDDPAQPQHRTLRVRAEGDGERQGRTLYYGSFNSNLGDEVVGMQVRRGGEKGSTVARIKFGGKAGEVAVEMRAGADVVLSPAQGHVEEEVAAEGEEAGEPKQEEQAGKKHRKSKDKQRANHFHFAVAGLARPLAWRSTAEFLHDGKGRGKGGDLELVDVGSGEVVAAFLNHWDGSRTTRLIGKLCVTQKAAELGLEDEVAVTVMGLMVRTVLRRNGLGHAAGLSAGAFVGALVLCVVS